MTKKRKPLKRKVSLNTDESTAYHEAGHAVMCWLVGQRLRYYIKVGKQIVTTQNSEVDIAGGLHWVGSDNLIESLPPVHDGHNGYKTFGETSRGQPQV